MREFFFFFNNNAFDSSFDSFASNYSASSNEKTKKNEIVIKSRFLLQVLALRNLPASTSFNCHATVERTNGPSLETKSIYNS